MLAETKTITNNLLQSKREQILQIMDCGADTHGFSYPVQFHRFTRKHTSHGGDLALVLQLLKCIHEQCIMCGGMSSNL